MNVRVSASTLFFCLSSRRVHNFAIRSVTSQLVIIKTKSLKYRCCDERENVTLISSRLVSRSCVSAYHLSGLVS